MAMYLLLYDIRTTLMESYDRVEKLLVSLQSSPTEYDDLLGSIGGESGGIETWDEGGVIGIWRLESLV